MKKQLLDLILRHRWFLGFTAAFAVLVAFVFWGTWSPEVAPVMPDDGVSHPLSRLAQFQGWWRGFVATGKFIPGDLISQGIVVSKYWTQEFKYAFAAYCAAAGLAFFLIGRGLSRPAAYGAGLLLCFSGYWLTLFSAGHAGWFQWMTYGTFAFGFADRAIRAARIPFGTSAPAWAFLGACLAWGSFYQPDLWLLFTALTAAYALALCVRMRVFPWKGALLAALTFAVIAAPSIRDAFVNSLSGRDRQIAETVRPPVAGSEADPAAQAKAEAEARWIFTTNWSLPPAETAEFVIPRLNGDTSCQMTLSLARAAGKDTKPYTGALGRPLGAPRGNYRQHALYVGFVTCLLACVGVVLCRRRGLALFFAVAAVVSCLFSFGRYCEPVYRLVYSLPFGDYLRAPVKWHHLTEFALAVLAGLGLDALWKRAKGPWWRAALVALVLGGAIDLARVDRLYCAPIDLSLVRGRQAAAELVARLGGGRVADVWEGGQGLVAWSFGAHGVSVTGDPNDEGVRFVWAGAQQVRQSKALSAFLDTRARLVGSFAVTGKGVYAVAPNEANAVLYRLVEARTADPVSRWGKMNGALFALGLLSAFGSCAVLIFGIIHHHES